MAMTAGAKPTSYTSTLTGVASTIYNAKVGDGIYKTGKYTETVGATTYEERQADYEVRVLSEKLEAWTEANYLILHIQSAGVVNTILTGTAGGDPITGTGLGGVS